MVPHIEVHTANDDMLSNEVCIFVHTDSDIFLPTIAAVCVIALCGSQQ